MLPRHAGALGVAVLGSILLALGGGPAAAQDTPLVSGVHHVHMNVVDPDLSIAFYTGAFESTRKTEVAGWPAVRSEDVHLLFEQVTEPASAELDTPLWHFGWNSPDLLADYERIAALGVEFFRVPPPSGHMYSPDGIDVEISPYGPLSGGTGPRTFNHVHLMSDAPLCAAEWYERMLGLERLPPIGGGDAPADCRVEFGPRRDPGNQIHQPNARLKAGDILLFIYPNQRPERPLVSPRGRVLDHVGLATSDLSATLAHLRAHGVTVLEDVHRFGDSDLQAALIEGPDRLAIKLVETSEAPAQASRRLLLLTHNAFYKHDSLAAAEAAVAELGREGGFEVTSPKGYLQEADAIDLSFISADYLAQFDGVMMMTNGELPLSGEQRRALVEFVSGGGGFVAVHQTVVTLYTFPWFGELVGAYLARGPIFDVTNREQRVAVLNVEDRDHPATRMLGESWALHDEFYQFAREAWDPARPEEAVGPTGHPVPYAFSRDRVNVLLSFDSERTDFTGLAPDWERGGDYPQAWYQHFGRGRSFYTSLGHRADLWSGDATFRAHMLGAIQWALGLAD